MKFDIIAVSNEAIKHLVENCKNLKSLSVHSAILDDEALSYIEKNLLYLEELHIVGTNVTSKGIAMLTKLPLKSIDLR